MTRAFASDRPALACVFALCLLAGPTFAGSPVVVPVEPEPTTDPFMGDMPDWSGLYLGLFATRAGGDNTWVDNSPTAAIPGNWSGTLPGVTLGYDWQRGNLVYGLGLSATSGQTYATGTTSSNFNCGTGCMTSIDGLTTLYARLGFATGNALIYVVAGASKADAQGTSDGFVTDVSGSLNGSTVGVGIESMLGDKLSLSAEYLRTDLGTLDLGFACGFECHTDVDFDQLKFGVNYHW